MAEQQCPDGGACHHKCGTTSCFRVVFCAPMGRERWTPEEVAANPPENVRPSIEAYLVNGG